MESTKEEELKRGGLHEALTLLGSHGGAGQGGQSTERFAGRRLNDADESERGVGASVLFCAHLI